MYKLKFTPLILYLMATTFHLWMANVLKSRAVITIVALMLV